MTEKRTPVTVELTDRQRQRLGYYTRATNTSGADAFDQALRLLFKRHPKKSRKPVERPKPVYVPREHNGILVICEDRTVAYAERMQRNLAADYGIADNRLYVNSAMTDDLDLKRDILDCLSLLHPEAKLGLLVETSSVAVRMEVTAVLNLMKSKHATRVQVEFYTDRKYLLQTIGRVLDGETT